MNLLVEPRPGIGPPAFGGGLGNAENFGGFLDFQADEIAELDQLGLLRLQRVVEREQLVIGRRAGNVDLGPAPK